MWDRANLKVKYPSGGGPDFLAKSQWGHHDRESSLKNQHQVEYFSTQIRTLCFKRVQAFGLGGNG